MSDGNAFGLFLLSEVECFLQVFTLAWALSEETGTAVTA